MGRPRRAWAVVRRALITGITGQDGSYLAEHLLRLGYEVHGLVRPSTSVNTTRISHLLGEANGGAPQVHLHQCDLQDGGRLGRLVHRLAPDEVYNLAAQSHVGESFRQPEHTGMVVAIGATNLLEAVREGAPEARFYQAGSSEMFGRAPAPQSETSPFLPCSPYANAKLYAYWMTRTYREAYGMFAVTGVLFNHESPRRSPSFVTRKTTQGVARIIARRQDRLILGDLEARRDWGHARDYVVAMHRMLQLQQPEDLVVGTGETWSVRDLVQIAFEAVGLDWQDFVVSDPREFRPTEVAHLQADPARAITLLDWKPETSFRELIIEMLTSDLALEGLTMADACELAAPRIPSTSRAHRGR